MQVAWSVLFSLDGGVLSSNGWNPVKFDVINLNVGNAWNETHNKVDIVTSGIYYVQVDMTVCYSRGAILNLNINSVIAFQVYNLLCA